LPFVALSPTHAWPSRARNTARDRMNNGESFGTDAAWPAAEDTDTTTSEFVREADAQATTYFREHAEPVFRYIVGVFGLEHDAEEVTQEAFLRLYLALKDRKQIESPRAWIIMVARRLMLDRLKHDRCKAGRRFTGTPELAEAVCDPAPTPEAALVHRRRKAALRKAVRALSEVERECLLGRAEGLKLREIAGVVNLDLRRVAEIVDRAVDRLHRQMQIRG
jgi:RNA polymerase sigma factor (sigma-70 family)